VVGICTVDFPPKMWYSYQTLSNTYPTDVWKGRIEMQRIASPINNANDVNTRRLFSFVLLRLPCLMGDSMSTER